MHERLDARGLSPAERDIALVTVRGLRTADIARARGIRDDTVKSQLATIFRKSGVVTRPECEAMFIDEVPDLTARDAASHSP